jgi:hypothetical protein
MNRVCSSVALLAGALFLSGGCASSSSSTPASQPAPAQAARPIPADSPLAKVKVGMGMKEVHDLIGQPTDTDTHITGKQFNPFYYGGDTTRVTDLYKGLGRITYTRPHAFTGDMRVMDDGIVYDPSETGYK